MSNDHGQLPAAAFPEGEFEGLLKRAKQATSEEDRKAILERAAKAARKERYEAEPPPSCPDPVADLRRDCLYHLRQLDLLELNPRRMAGGNIASPIPHFWQRMRDLYQSQKVSKKPPLEPDRIVTGYFGGESMLVGAARKADLAILDWCMEAMNQPPPPCLTPEISDQIPAAAVDPSQEDKTHPGGAPPDLTHPEWIKKGPLGLTINTNTHTVERNGQRIEFKGNSRSWEVFMKLVNRYPGRHTAQELGREVWNPEGKDVDPDDNLVQKSIASTRKILTHLGVTVEHTRKVGYILADLDESAVHTRG
jgi:hypothetical protein